MCSGYLGCNQAEKTWLGRFTLAFLNIHKVKGEPAALIILITTMILPDSKTNIMTSRAWKF